MDECFTKNTAFEVAFLIKELQLQPGMKLLDVGCGTGVLIPFINSSLTENNLVVEFVPNPDIARKLGEMKSDIQCLVGFALETNDEELNARDKMERKNLDLIVLNSLNDKQAGFGFDTNKVTILGRNGTKNEYELKSKTEVARDIVDEIASLLAK